MRAGVFASLKKLIRPANKATVKGLYLWGGVGTGKTYFMNALHDSLPFRDKKRIHFHRFMKRVHRDLKNINAVEDPLEVVAQDLVRRARVICLDEFHVSDITDAMLLSGLLKALFDGGVTLVVTSNEPPDRLYWEGLQRERFLPAIDLIKTQTAVVMVDGGVNYRLRILEKEDIYHYPLDNAATQSLADCFTNIAPDAGIAGVVLEINGWPMPTVRCADGVAWFEFDELCGGPWSVADYIEIARCYHTVVIANIPSMDDVDNDKVRRLINLVDEFYDRNVKLIISAEAPPTALYRDGKLSPQFSRTVSRLEEMRSHDYLARPHFS